MAHLTESVVEQAALAWLESAGWSVKDGAEIVPGERAAERDDYGQVVLAQRLRDALARLNPALPAEALEDAFRKLTRPEGAEPVAAVRRGEPCDSRRAVRRMEDFAIAHRGDQCLYAVSELTRDEYRRMFDCALYDSVRQKYQAEGVFMDTYDKVKRPV